MFVESATVGSSANEVLVEVLSENYFAATGIVYDKKCVVPSLVIKFHAEEIEKINAIFNSLSCNMEFIHPKQKKIIKYGRILAESGHFVYCIYNIHDKKFDQTQRTIEIRKHRRKTPLRSWSKEKREFVNTVLGVNVQNHDCRSCLSVPFEKSDIYPITIALQAKKIEVSPSFTQTVGGAIEEAQDEEIYGNKNVIEFHKKTRVDVAAEVAVNNINRLANSSTLGQAASNAWNSFASYWGY